MSTFHYINNRSLIQDHDLLKMLKKLLPKYNIKKIAYNNLESLYYADKLSTKGVNLDISPNGYTLRNTVFSNQADMLLTNAIALSISNMLKTPVEDEEGNIIAHSKIYKPEFFEKNMIKDAQSILQIAFLLEDLTLFGPLERVHLGKNTARKLKKYEEKPLKIATELEQLFLKVNYQIQFKSLQPSMEINNQNGEKLVTAQYHPKTSCVIKKYDLLMLPSENKEEYVLIKNENLNKILPSSWELIDEFTIIAPSLSEKEYNILFNNAKQFEETF